MTYALHKTTIFPTLRNSLYLVSLIVGSLGIAGMGDTASATTIVLTAPGCAPPTKIFDVPGSGGVSSVGFACPVGLDYTAGGGASVGAIATHTHSLAIQSPAQGGRQGPFTIESGPYTVRDGFAISTFLDGFASFQGDAGSDDVFTWTATLTATFLGGSSSVSSSGSINSSPQQRIRKFDIQSYPRRNGTDLFFSTLTVVTSGPGELHLERTGIATLAPVPEPSTWSFMIVSFGLISAKLRRRHRANRAGTTIKTNRAQTIPAA